MQTGAACGMRRLWAWAASACLVCALLSLGAPRARCERAPSAAGAAAAAADGGAGAPAEKREFSINSLIDSALEKEFRKDELMEEQDKAAGTAGRSFNKSVTQETAHLETVARVRDKKDQEKRKKEAAALAAAAAEGAGGGDAAGKTSGAGKSGGAGGGKSSEAEGSTPDAATATATSAGPGELSAWTLSGNMNTLVEAMEALSAASGDSAAEDVARLIDSSDNEYVLSSPKHAMELQQDLRLVADIVTMVTAAAVGGLVFALFRQPMITGYLAAGATVGPGGLQAVKELVQVETLSQFGVVLLLFCLGLEFSMTKLRAVRGVAVAGGITQVAVLMLTCGALSKMFGAPVAEGLFIGAFLSMSSTAVVLKILGEKDQLATLYGQITVGTLILQDLLVGVFFSLLPVLGGDTSGGFVALCALAVRIALFVAGAMFVARRAVAQLLRALQRLDGSSGELFQIGMVAFCLVVAWASDALGLSIEMGAFVAGAMVSSTGEAERVLHAVEPIKNLFTALFLASIGMVINPHFLWLHLDILLCSLVLTITAKTALFGTVVRAFGYSAATALSVGMAMSQIGEFAFVLLSRASTLGLVHHRLYLLLLGTTALSLLTSPFTFWAMPHALRLGARLGWLPRKPLIDSGDRAV